MYARLVKGGGLTLMALGLFVASAGPVCAPEPIDLGTLGGDESLAAAVNKAKVVVGGAMTAGGAWHAFLWQDGAMTDLGTLGGDAAEAHDLTESPDLTVVGTSLAPSASDANNLVERAFLWHDGAMTDLGPDDGDADSEAWAINESHQVVGGARFGDDWQAFLWQAGTMTSLGTLGGIDSIAYDINADGIVVGYSDAPAPMEDPNQPALPDVKRAFLWQSGTMTDLGTLGGRNSTAYGIDDGGNVTGWTDTADGERHAFLWNATDGMQDLGTLGGTVSEAWGARGSTACGYSVDPNTGQILGYWLGTTYGLIQLENPFGTGGPVFVHAMGQNARTVGSAQTADGEMHAFLRRFTTVSEVLP